jgi:outer membrane protein assembly factor BamB
MKLVPLFSIALLGSAAIPLALGEPVEKTPADSWPCFLGPERNGISRTTGLNLDWHKKTPKILWKIPLGSGFSSVSFAGQRMFTMAEREKKQFVVCLDADTGKQQWMKEVAPGYLDGQKQGPGPRSTPTFDGGRLYCLLPAGQLYCLKADDGEVVWKINIFEATGANNHAKEFFYWGMSGSPLMEGDLVIAQPGGNKGNSIAAFHRDTGKLAWSSGDDPPSYASPIVVTGRGRRMIVCLTGNALVGLEPTKGEILWRFVLENKFDTNCAMPLWLGDRFFVSSSYGAGSVLLDLVAEGDKLAVKQKWHSRQMQNQFTTSIALDGAVYGCHGDLGACTLRCISLADGKQKWIERAPGKCGLVAAEGHLFCLSENGTLRLIEANAEKYALKGEMKGLLGDKAWAAPALWDRKLYLRDPEHLACVDVAR